MLALVYHYSAHQRFRKLVKSSAHNPESRLPKLRAHLLVPLFLAELQTKQVGGQMHEKFSRNLILLILKKKLEILQPWP